MFASAMEVSCSRYISEPGACNYLGTEIKLLNRKKVYILGGKKALEAVLSKIELSLSQESLQYEVGVFEGYCTYDNAAFHAKRLQDTGCDCIVGVGGGRCMDTAKAISKMISVPFGTIPTQLATCVSCTNMAIMYENSGAFSGPLYPDLPIAFVLADHDILVRAPVRYIASGIADSMAKYPELHFSQRGTYNCAELDDAAAQAAHSMAVCTWNIYLENGWKAYSDNKNGIISNEFSAVANANLVITGVISGLARGSKQLAIAHALYNSSTTVFPETWRNYLHGEIVSVGVLLQEFYNEAPEAEIEDFLMLNRKMGVPVCLNDLGIAGTAKELDDLHQAIIKDFTDFSAEEKRKLRVAMDRIIKI